MAVCRLGVTAALLGGRQCSGPGLVARATIPLQEAARQTVDYFVRSDMVVGLGTGLGSGYAIQYIGQKLKNGTLRNVRGIAMSSYSASEAAKAGIDVAASVLKDLAELVLQLDVAFDDVDIVQEGTLYAVLGRRGAVGRESILKEKTIAAAAKQLVFILKEDQFVTQLEGPVPVIIKRENWLDTAEEIDDLFIGEAEVWRRPSHGQAGPFGGDNPMVTVEGHFVLDIMFTGPIANPVQVAENLDQIDGVITHGIVHNIAYAAAIAGKDEVKIRTSLFKDVFTPTGD